MYALFVFLDTNLPELPGGPDVYLFDSIDAFWEQIGPKLEVVGVHSIDDYYRWIDTLGPLEFFHIYPVVDRRAK